MQSIRDAVILLAMLLLAATVRISPPRVVGDLVPAAEAAAADPVEQDATPADSARSLPALVAPIRFSAEWDETVEVRVERLSGMLFRLDIEPDRPARSVPGKETVRDERPCGTPGVGSTC